MTSALPPCPLLLPHRHSLPRVLDGSATQHDCDVRRSAKVTAHTETALYIRIPGYIYIIAGENLGRSVRYLPLSLLIKQDL